MNAVICPLCTGAHMAIDCPRNVDVAQLDLLKPDCRSPLPQPDYQPCGTYAAAVRHRRRGEPLDDECRLAERAYLLPLQRSWRARNADRERARLRAKDARRRSEGVTPPA